MAVVWLPIFAVKSLWPIGNFVDGKTT